MKTNKKPYKLIYSKLTKVMNANTDDNTKAARLRDLCENSAFSDWYMAKDICSAIDNGYWTIQVDFWLDMLKHIINF